MGRQAFESAKSIKHWRKEWPESLGNLLERFCEKQGQTAGVKDFISVLMFYRDHSAADVHGAVEKARENQQSHEKFLLNN